MLLCTHFVFLAVNDELCRAQWGHGHNLRFCVFGNAPMLSGQLGGVVLWVAISQHSSCCIVATIATLTSTLSARRHFPIPLRICGRVSVNAAIATRLAYKFHTIAENHFSHIFTFILHNYLSCKFRFR